MMKLDEGVTKHAEAEPLLSLVLGASSGQTSPGWRCGKPGVGVSVGRVERCLWRFSHGNCRVAPD